MPKGVKPIRVRPLLALKGQVLANFLAELPKSDVIQDNNGWWILNVDGASPQTGAGASLELKPQLGKR